MFRYCGRSLPDSRFRACEEIERRYKHSSFPRKRESLCGVSVRKTGPTLRAAPPDSRFRGNDEVLFGGIVFTVPTPRRSVRHDESRPISSHARKRESGGGRPQCRPGFITETPQQIPAFAGMTSICKAVRFLHTLFRGNDEVLFGGYCLLQCRYFGDPAVMIGDARFRRTLFRGNDEDWCGLSIFSHARKRGSRLRGKAVGTGGRSGDERASGGYRRNCRAGRTGRSPQDPGAARLHRASRAGDRPCPRPNRANGRLRTRIAISVR